jgi:hypothetical protein
MAEKDIKEKFARNVQDALTKAEKRGSVFNAGKPHKIFVQKGVPNNPIHIRRL